MKYISLFTQKNIQNEMFEGIYVVYMCINNTHTPVLCTGLHLSPYTGFRTCTYMPTGIGQAYH